MKKIYTLLTALAATAAMNAAETQSLTCWLSICDDDNNWTYASSTITVNAQIDGNDVVFVDWLSSSQNPDLENPQRDLHFTVSDDYVVSCGVLASGFASEKTGWKKNLWQLGEYGSFTHMYLVSGDTSENDYCKYSYDPDTKYFRINTWFENRDASGNTVEDSDDYYCLTIKMPDDFLASVAQKDDATGYLVGSDDSWGEGFTFTQTYTVSGGVVTLTNFLGSSQNVEITAYSDGKAKQTGGLSGYVSDSYTFGDDTYARVYFDDGSYFYCEYDTDENKLWIEGYIYAEETGYSYQYFGMYVNLPDGFTPEEAAEATVATGTTKVLVNGVEYSTSISYNDGVLTLPNFLSGGQEVSFTISEDSDGIRTATANFGASYISITTDAYYNFYQFGTSYPQYVTYVQVEDGQDYIQWGGYLYASANDYTWLTDAIKIFIPSDETFVIYNLVGEYTGSTAGYEYVTQGSGYSTTVPETVFDGETNAYVKIEAGDADNEVIISNLIPTGLSFIAEQGGPVTGVVATSDQTGYIASITIQPVDYGKLTYTYGTDNYTVSVRLGAAWGDNWYSAPTAPVVLMVKEDYSIQSNWTGQGLYVDWNGDQSSWAYGLYTGCGKDILTKVTEDAGVKTVTVAEDNTDAPVQYFNLNGIRVNGDNLTPGLYIRRQGTKATKVIVR